MSQAYRPVQFADLSAPPTTDIVDQQLKDAKGFNVDAGVRGKYGDVLIFDASIYRLQYNNRIGTIIQQRQDGSFYNLRTNVGDSKSNGIEALIEHSLFRKFLYPRRWELRFFTSFALNDSRYGDFKVITKSNNQLIETNLRNKYVENAPAQIIRSGITIGFRNISITYQLSRTSSVFSDANNTIRPSANGNIGLIPSYTIYDLTFAWSMKNMHLKAGVNNLTNEFYFTRRASGYPGPGALPADGRTFFLTVGTKL
jgi:Fe(3+) dicitrate transport protein